MRANVHLDILLKRLWMLPMSATREGETPPQIWGRMMRLFAHALNTLQGEGLYDVGGEEMAMHIVCVQHDDEWKPKLIRLMEVESCHLAKDVMGAAVKNKYWKVGPNVLDELMDDLGINYSNIDLD